MSKINNKQGKGLVVAVIVMAFAIVGAGAFAVTSLTGCSGDTAQKVQEEEKPIINPITGIEAPDGLYPRPVMVSIPNAPDGAVPQSNLTQADIIYEFPVEGELTRLQAVYLTERPDKFGPIRSVRYYFVDLAREYKAVHVGYGWGKHAHKYMRDNGIYHINGMQDTELIYRSDEKAAPNNAYITWENVKKMADEEGWFDEQKSENIRPFKFRDEEWEKEKAEAQKTIEELGESEDPEDVQAVEDAKTLVAEPAKATSISVSSTGCKSNCTYNEETGLYDRFWYGDPYIDKETGEQLSFNNILVQKVKSSIMTDVETGASDPKGRLDIDMNSTGEAYLFTNGEMVKGTWSKASPAERTIFKDENGREFRFSQGKTWVYVVDQNLNFEYE